MITKSVAISGTVGKQVFVTSGAGKTALLRGVVISPISANSFVRIRDGNASGTIVVEQSVLANSSVPLDFKEGIRFDNGMHVKVLGTGAVCYLLLN